MKALAKRPIDRYQDAASMRRDLQAASRGAAVAAPTVDTWREATQPTRAMTTTRVNEPLQRAQEHDAAPPLTLDRPQRAERDLAAEERERKQASRRKATIWSLVAAVIVLALVAAGVYVYKSHEDASPETVTIPSSVIGQPLDQAKATLEDLGLVVKEGDPVASSTIAANLVAESDPAPGTSVAAGSTVTLKPSSGPSSVTVPDLKGQTQENARKMLESAKLKAGNVTQEDSPDVDAGTIIRTSPSAGSAASEGDTVDLVVASGYMTIDSDQVIGKSKDDAIAYLNGLGMRVNTQTQQSSDAQPGTVIQASPTGHQKVGSSVTITVAEQPPSPSTPSPSSSSPSTPSTSATTP